MTESVSGRVALLAAWQGLGGLLAAAAGAGTSLLSLLRGVALDVSCLRGGLVFLAALAVTRIGSVVLARAWRGRPGTREDHSGA